MTNRVDIEVTGSNKFDITQAAVNKQLKSIETQAVKTSVASKKLTTVLAEKPKLDGIKEAEKAVKKLQDTADEAFDKVREKMESSFEKLGKEHETKIKVTPEIDKTKIKSAFDGFSFDVDITKGIGPKIAAALGKGIDLAQAGLKGAQSFVSGLGDGLKNQHPAVQAAVYAALAGAVLTVGPFLGATLAGGVIAGFGAGIAGIGIVAAAQSDRVRSTWMDLWDEIVAGTRARSGAIEVVLLNTAQRAKTIATKISADFAGAINDIAPGLERLFDGLLKSVEKFAPALRPIAQAASAVFEDLGSRLPDIIGEMAEEFADLADIVRENPEALGDFVAAVGEAVEQVTLFLEVMTTTYNGVKSFFDFIGKGLSWDWAEEGEGAVGKVGSKMTELGTVTGTADGKLQGIEQSFRALAEAEDDAAKRGDAFLEVMNRLAGRAPTFDEALKDTNDTIRDLIDNFGKTGAAADGMGKQLLNADGTINTLTKNGSTLYDAITGLQENFSDMAGATKELEAAGMSHEAAVKKVNDAFAVQSGRLLDAAGKMGLTQDQMRELLRLYGLTPEQIDTLLKLDDADFRNRMTDNLRTQTKTVNVVYNNLNAPLTQGTGKMIGATDYAFGGNISNAAAGGVRSREVRINDGPGGYPGEAVRMPDGATVWPAGMTRMMMQQASQGFGNSMGGGGGTIVVKGGAAYGLEAVFIEWLKMAVRDNGGDASVFGGG
jgi:ABC-type transporter Mla subunit MlaD